LDNSTTKFYIYHGNNKILSCRFLALPSHFQQGPDSALGRQQNLHNRRDRALTGSFRHSMWQMTIARVLFTHAREFDFANIDINKCRNVI